MKELDQYHQWVDWNEEDQVYLGRCSNLITGIHGEDPVALDGELCAVVKDVIRHFNAEGRPLPPPRVRPMREVA
ncbi:pilus assembly protein HicB [uncultured Thiocystis sp.]|jgi:hypothetical protein|uniref:pilus assembly protein HicB n=1 Tax=uncultured Thiocystis sp. TaxID=1202134 RepID=UPI0025D8DD93|nr:pilus assembly protein HicB [uncultured Thiocystis sp.]